MIAVSVVGGVYRRGHGKHEKAMRRVVLLVYTGIADKVTPFIVMSDDEFLPIF